GGGHGIAGREDREEGAGRTADGGHVEDHGLGTGGYRIDPADLEGHGAALVEDAVRRALGAGARTRVTDAERLQCRVGTRRDIGVAIEIGRSCAAWIRDR